MTPSTAPLPGALAALLLCLAFALTACGGSDESGSDSSSSDSSSGVFDNDSSGVPSDDVAEESTLPWTTS